MLLALQGQCARAVAWHTMCVYHMRFQDERGKDMVFSVDSKPSMRAASAARPTGAFGQRYPINLAAKADSPAVANVSATHTGLQINAHKAPLTCIC